MRQFPFLICLLALALSLVRGGTDAVAWEVKVENNSPKEAFVCGETIYMVVVFDNGMYGHGGIGPTPGLPTLKYPNKNGYRADQMLMAIDGRSGKVRWGRPYEGEFLFVADPRGRDAYALGSAALQIDAMTGQTLREVLIPPRTTDSKKEDFWRQVSGVRIGGVAAVGRSRFGHEVPETARLFDLDANETIDFSTNARSFDKLNHFDTYVDQSPSLVQTHFQMRPIGGGNAVWRFTTAGYSSNRPVLIDNDLLVLSGQRETVGQVSRLSGKSGVPIWTTRLPRGAYPASNNTLRGGAYAPANWSAAGPLDAAHCYAISGNGYTMILDSGSGEIVGRARGDSIHVTAPHLIGENLVLIGQDWVRAIPWASVLANRTPPSVDEILKQSAAALNARRFEEAAKLTAAALHAWPLSPEAWLGEAQIAEATNHPNTAVRAACHSLELSEQTATPLLNYFGLIARIPTGPLRAEMLPAGLSLYAPSTDGLLYVIDPQSREVIDRRPMKGDANSVFLRGNQLVRQGQDRRPEILFSTATLAAAPSRYDPLYRLFADENMGALGPAERTFPREWTTEGGGIGPQRLIGERRVRAVKGGGVRELRGEETVQHPPTLSGVAEWHINFTAAGPIGSGSGGVTRLDENFCPVAWLVDLRDQSNNFGVCNVLTVDSDGQTMALLIRKPEQDGLLFEIRTADGKTVVRSESVIWPARFDDLEREQARLLKLGDGYMYSGGEMVWLPTDAKKSVWRFRVNPDAYLKVFRPDEDFADRAFGVPRLIGEELFVGNRYGGVYVFDTRKIIGN